MTLHGAIAHSGLPPAEAQTLAAHALGATQVQIITGGKRELSATESTRLGALFGRRQAGEPMAYLVGTREFFSLEFGVTPAVLIPRPETELLVEFALARMAPGTACRVLDLGTGSGCIAIAIAKPRPRAAVTAADNSAAALAVASANVQQHAVPTSRWCKATGSARSVTAAST